MVLCPEIPPPPTCVIRFCGIPVPVPLMAAALGVAPASFICPVTRVIMSDPVTAAEGQSYERIAPLQWPEDNAAMRSRSGRRRTSQRLSRSSWR